MKTPDEINLNYSRAVRQAEWLEGRARELENLANTDFQECLANIEANWKGENARIFIGKGNKLKGDLEKSADQLGRVAKSIRSAAKRTREADIAARNIALSSGSDGEPR